MKKYFIAAGALLVATAAHAQSAKSYSSDGITLTPVCKNGAVKFDFTVKGENPIISGLTNFYFNLDDGDKKIRRALVPPAHKGKGVYEVLDNSEQTVADTGKKLVGVTIAGHITASFPFRKGDAYSRTREACGLSLNHLAQ